MSEEQNKESFTEKYEFSTMVTNTLKNYLILELGFLAAASPCGGGCNDICATAGGSWMGELPVPLHNSCRLPIISLRLSLMGESGVLSRELPLLLENKRSLLSAGLVHGEVGDVGERGDRGPPFIAVTMPPPHRAVNL